MAHDVICLYCNMKFDRDKIPFVKINDRRYAHVECHEIAESKKPQEVKDYEALERYIKKLFDMPVLNANIRKQIKDYHETYHFTYTGMLKTLQWWCEIKHNVITHGTIGIIPLVYKEAERYYFDIYQAQEQAKKIKEFKNRVKEFEIYPPQVWVAPLRLFNLDDEEDDV